MQDLVIFYEAKICQISWLSQFQQLRSRQLKVAMLELALVSMLVRENVVLSYQFIVQAGLDCIGAGLAQALSQFL
ncbi:hypothetical protein [Nostoc sp. PCC 9305]|uniref:hypothetical protein n=1 Tax=Nostoc sp. PCC 9305 TaxID=296636 RepID=UPI0039C65C7F